MIKKEREECTFKPKITKSQSNKEITKSERWKNLQRGKEDIYKQREMQRLVNEGNQIKQECPFKPTIHETNIVKETHAHTVHPIEERLINQNKNKVSERERIKRHVDEIEQKSYPYKPNISEVSEKIVNQLQNRDKPI
jgi:hypothetical protein